jgi:hypothetical protein
MGDYYLDKSTIIQDTPAVINPSQAKALFSPLLRHHKATLNKS